MQLRPSFRGDEYLHVMIAITALALKQQPNHNVVMFEEWGYQRWAFSVSEFALPPPSSRGNIKSRKSIFQKSFVIISITKRIDDNWTPLIAFLLHRLETNLGRLKLNLKLFRTTVYAA
jgi:hypothetical protein